MAYAIVREVRQLRRGTDALVGVRQALAGGGRHNYICGARQQHGARQREAQRLAKCDRGRRILLRELPSAEEGRREREATVSTERAWRAVTSACHRRHARAREQRPRVRARRCAHLPHPDRRAGVIEALVPTAGGLHRGHVCHATRELVLEVSVDVVHAAHADEQCGLPRQRATPRFRVDD